MIRSQPRVSVRCAVVAASLALVSGSRGETALTSRFDAFPEALREKVRYIIILYPENRSFDSLYGSFPGADGIAQAAPENALQVDRTGKPLPYLSNFNTNGIPGISNGPDPRFPTQLANGPFDIAPYVPDGYIHGDLVHKFYTEQYMINSKADRFAQDPNNAGGAPMSKFSTWSSNPGLVMGHYDEHAGGEGSAAREFTLCDHAFHSAFGGSFLNHQWLISARTPVWPAATANPKVGPPKSYFTQFINGLPSTTLNGPLSDAVLSNEDVLPKFPYSSAAQSLQKDQGDHWAINTVLPLNGPAGGFKTARTDEDAPASLTPPENRLPLQTYDTIGDRLSGAGIPWAWYSGGWKDAKAGRASYLFQFHHQPFAYFKNFALKSCPVPQHTSPGPDIDPVDTSVAGEDSDSSAKFLKDEDADFYPALENGTLPQVCFVKPIGEHNSHPGYASVRVGQGWVGKTIERIKHSPIWPQCVVFVMYDEHGGMWDHVQPPRIDEWGPGLRVPLIVASPFAKNGFVDHSQYETVSLLAFIEQIFHLPPLNERDANALPPVAAFKDSPDLIVQATAGEPLRYRIRTGVAHGVFAWGSEMEKSGLSLDLTTGIISGNPAAGKFSTTLSIAHPEGVQKLSLLVDATAPRAK